MLLLRRTRFGLLAGTATIAAAFNAESMKASISSSIRPPVARREPHTVYFGVNPINPEENRGSNPMDPPVEMSDDLFWIRDDRRKNEEVLNLLHAENEYTDHKTAHLASFREVLYAEMLSHIQEDDDDHPVPAGDGYEYWFRTIKGKSFRQYLRRQIGAAADAVQLYLDVNAVPLMPFFASNPNWDAKQCDVQSIKPSPSGKLLAYCVDGSGYETYDVRLKDLESGAELEETIGDTAGNIAWAGDGTLFYTRQDKAHRAYQVWRHALGTNSKQDEMVYEDPDELFNVVRSSAAIPASGLIGRPVLQPHMVWWLVPCSLGGLRIAPRLSRASPRRATARCSSSNPRVRRRWRCTLCRPRRPRIGRGSCDPVSTASSTTSSRTRPPGRSSSPLTCTASETARCTARRSRRPLIGSQ
jgi:oligopeptidase B